MYSRCALWSLFRSVRGFILHFGRISHENLVRHGIKVRTVPSEDWAPKNPARWTRQDCHWHIRSERLHVSHGAHETYGAFSVSLYVKQPYSLQLLSGQHFRAKSLSEYQWKIQASLFTTLIGTLPDCNACANRANVY